MLERALTAAGVPCANDVASALLTEFHSAAAAVTASPSRLLRAASGDTAVVNALTSFRADVEHILRHRVADRPIVGSMRALKDYLRFDMAHATVEVVRVLHLNSLNRLLCDDTLFRGTVDEAPFYSREIIGRAIELGSTGLILVHNHPSGKHDPSTADLTVTRELIIIARRLNIVVHDHIIVAASGISSMRQLGYL